jgi:tRNA (guanine26-N2/guanine27-N2)-dimethyltransferase
MWSAPIHDKAFVERVLTHLEGNEDKYGTAARMKGMLTVAKEVRAPSIVGLSRSASNIHHLAGIRDPFLLHPRKVGRQLPH